jgi:NAD(P)-dependent dehydrogenase (short-subunit alcohol dehydrogenase family)
MTVLRRNLLGGRRIAVAGEVPAVADSRLRALGAQVEVLATGELPAEEERTGEWARTRVPLHALVYFAGGFNGGGDGPLAAVLEEAWVTVREVATGALIEETQPAKLLLVAPRAQDGALAHAVRAALENLARTLSVEWARYGLTSVMIAPGRLTTDDEVAELVCFLVSDAGAYLSGCRLELGAVA